MQTPPLDLGEFAKLCNQSLQTSDHPLAQRIEKGVFVLQNAFTDKTAIEGMSQVTFIELL